MKKSCPEEICNMMCKKRDLQYVPKDTHTSMLNQNINVLLGATPRISGDVISVCSFSSPRAAIYKMQISVIGKQN